MYKYIYYGYMVYQIYENSYMIYDAYRICSFFGGTIYGTIKSIYQLIPEIKNISEPEFINLDDLEEEMNENVPGNWIVIDKNKYLLC